MPYTPNYLSNLLPAKALSGFDGLALNCDSPVAFHHRCLESGLVTDQVEQEPLRTCLPTKIPTMKQALNRLLFAGAQPEGEQPVGGAHPCIVAPVPRWGF